MNHNPQCNRCQLCESATHNICVMGKGAIPSPLMLIGEAPGFSEDMNNEPFVGQAARLLNHILDKLSIKRDDIYITNCLKCRPPKNKLPKVKELRVCWDQCRPYLMQEIRDVRPKAIVLLGNTPLELVADRKFIGKHEGTICEITGLWKTDPKQEQWDFEGFIPCLACFHPAAALRNPKLEPSIGTALYVAAREAGLSPKIKKGGEFYDYETF